MFNTSVFFCKSRRFFSFSFIFNCNNLFSSVNFFISNFKLLFLSSLFSFNPLFLLSLPYFSFCCANIFTLFINSLLLLIISFFSNSNTFSSTIYLSSIKVISKSSFSLNLVIIFCKFWKFNEFFSKSFNKFSYLILNSSFSLSANLTLSFNSDISLFNFIVSLIKLFCSSSTFFCNSLFFSYNSKYLSSNAL